MRRMPVFVWNVWFEFLYSYYLLLVLLVFYFVSVGKQFIQ